MINFIKLTLNENDKRLIIVLLLVFILLFVIIGYISLFIKKIMKTQGEKIDGLVKDVYDKGLLKTEKSFISFGIKKNWITFFSQAGIAMIILASAWLLYLCVGFFMKDGDFSLIKVFDYGTYVGDGVPAIGGEGFDTILFVYDWNKLKFSDFLFFKNIKIGWPETINTPHWSWDAWFSYLFVPANVVGGIWFLVAVQAYIARSFRIFKKANELYKKTLDNSAPSEKLTAQQTNVNQLTNNNQNNLNN